MITRTARAGITLAVTALVASVATMSPAAAVPDYVLDAAGVEQVVLRAQPPTTIGAWRQNEYFTWDSSHMTFYPYVCYTADGTQARLPRPRTLGGVGYSIINTRSTGKNPAISLYQYPTQARADQALAALRTVDCPDATKVRTDVGSIVAGKQSTEFTDASRTGLTTIVRYRYDGGAGMMTMVSVSTTTQVGLVVLQTQIGLSGRATSPATVAKAVAMNKAWHAGAVAAYEAFGSGGSR